jgi:hypothetical protein
MSVMQVGPRRAVIMPARPRPALKMLVVPGIAAASAAATSAAQSAMDADANADAAAASAIAAAEAAADAEGVLSIVAGANVTVDDTDPRNPVLSAAGDVASVNGQTGTVVLDADDISDTSTTQKFVTTAQVSLIGSALQPAYIGITVQGWDADLDALAALSKADGNFIVGNGTTWVVENGATARTSLGLGTSDGPQFAAIQLGHASDTTLTRTGAGEIAVEGNRVFRAGGADVPLADGGTGASDAATARANLGLRDVLTANRTYYVRTDGNDSNSGLANTSGGAFFTIQRAVDVALGTLDFYGFTVTIQVGDGIYAGGVSVGVGVGIAAAASLVIQGNAVTPANVIISTTSNHAVTVKPGGLATAKYFEVRTTTSGFGLRAESGGVLEFLGIRFGAVANGHIISFPGGAAISLGAYDIVGSATRHIWGGGGYIQTTSSAVTITGSLTFTEFVFLERLSLLTGFNMTFGGTGSITGTRYSVSSNSVAFTNGGGASYFPGTVAGSTATGGQYV